MPDSCAIRRIDKPGMPSCSRTVLAALKIRSLLIAYSVREKVYDVHINDGLALGLQWIKREPEGSSVIKELFLPATNQRYVAFRRYHSPVAYCAGSGSCEWLQSG